MTAASIPFTQAHPKSTVPTHAAPHVSVLIPCRNEESHIEACLDSLIDDWVRANAEILVIDGVSQDRTQTLVRAYSDHCPTVRLIENPQGLQAYALNVGLANARGTVIVRADAHSEYPPSYVQTCVELLERVPAANVGGVMLPRGRTAFENAVADAMASRLGVGWSRFHLGDYTGYSDTVYLGTFRKELFDRVGLYDPAAHPAEDAELNCRILAENEQVYLDSSLRVEYQPRSTFRALMKQFFWYGRARCYVTQKHKRLFTLGRLAPPLLVAAIVGALILAPFQPVTLSLPLAYLASLAVLTIVRTHGQSGRWRQAALSVGVLATMHLSYGMGFILRLLRLIK